MTRAYVIYGEDGSYSDYSMTILHVSLDEERAKAKVAELEEATKRRNAAADECTAYEAALRIELPDPPGYPGSSDRAKLADWFERRLPIEAKRQEMLKPFKKDLAVRYELEDIDIGYRHDTSYDYAEVELV
jgi:hypothetical protein